MLHIKELTLIDFRSYENVKIDLCPNINVFYGDNGAGKTNILEAVFTMSAGRSHRTARDRDMIRYGAQNAFINLKVMRKDGEMDLSMMIPSNGSKRIKINGKYINRIAQLMGAVVAVIFSPEDLKLIKEGPEERRRFIDIFISQIKPSYLYNLQKYYKILENRNKILKDIKYDQLSPRLLDIWDEQLVSSGAAILTDRLSFIDEIYHKVSDIHGYITGGKETLTLKYNSSLNLISDIKSSFMSALSSHRSADIKMGTTTVGPHRDDIVVSINNMDMRYYGSQGQQRTAALSLKLGQLEVTERITGEPPILLLDDVMSELDAARQAMLMIYMNKYQTMLTCTHRPVYIGEHDKSAVFHVSDGRISI